MAKIKVRDVEKEVEDDIAELVADETGVPFRNRAAEARRKQEKAEKELDELRTWKAEQEVKARQAPAVQAPYTPGVYQAPAQTQAPVYYNQGMTEAQARQVAQEEMRRERDRREYEEETARLRQEWPEYDEQKDRVSDYLRAKGYSDEQIQSFGPRDIRLVRDAYSGAVKTQRGNKRSPQEVVLDTGGGEGFVDDASAGFKDGDFAKMDKAAFQKVVAEARMKARLGDE